jgi:Mn2+/Fe2+ NRAMP family transporter
VGTTIAPWQLFYIQSISAEKHISIKNLVYGKFDAIFGAFLTNFVAWFIIVACAATIFTARITVTDVPTIIKALISLASKYAGLLFAFGFLNASLFALCILPLSTVFPICESLGFEAGIHFNFKEAPIFHGLFFDYLNFECFNHPLNSNESFIKYSVL